MSATTITDVGTDALPQEARIDTTRRADRAWRRARRQTAAILISVVVVVALLWTIIVVAIATERRTTIGDARKDANNLSAAFRAEVTGKLDSIANAMDALVAQVRRDPDLDVYVWVQQHPVLAALPIQATFIVGPDGKLRATSRDPRAPPLDLSDRDYVRVHRDGSWVGPYVGGLEIGRLSGQPGMVISRRVDAADGRFLGVVAFSVAPHQLTALPVSIDLGPGSYLTLMGTDKVVRVRFGEDSPDGELGAGAVMPQLLAGVDPAAPVWSYIRKATLDGVTRLYSIRKLAGYPLYASVALDLDQVLRPAAEDARLNVTIGIIATVVLSVTAVLLVSEVRRRTDRESRLREDRLRLAAEIRSGNAMRAQLQASEARLTDFATMASDWFWEQDAELRFVQIGVAGTVDGVSYIGKLRSDIDAAGAQTEAWENHQRDLAARKPFRDFRYSRPGADGDLRHVSTSGNPVFDDAGQFVGYRGTGRDITAQVAAEAELRAAKDRAEQAETLLRDAVDSIAESFTIYDAEDRFVMCNDRFLEAYSRTADMMIPGTRFQDILRAGLARGDYLDAVGREEAWFEERVREFRECAGAVERQLSNGRWMLVTDRRMRNGGLAGLRVDITALKMTQAALRESQERLDRAQEIARIGSWELDVATGRFLWSKELYRIRGLSPDEFVPDFDNVRPYLHPDDLSVMRDWLADLLAGRTQGARETRIIRPGGEERLVRVDGRAEIDPDGIVRRVAGTMQDITERRLLERQLAQAQKMEAIGSLTGGMAHDFNNGLGVIIGNLDLLGRLVKADPVAAELCEEVRGGAQRCADLIRRLLAFARRQPLRPEQTDVNVLVNDTVRMLGRVLGQHITLTPHLDATLWPALADPVQLEAALVNLATNARDAMPKGGRFDITTRNVTLDDQYVTLYPDVVSGAYVLIEVSDTGSGITPDIIGRVFEPFFTTKEPGQGSGLGLSMVFGFAMQSGGHLTVYSEPDHGSTFRIYLPRAQAGDARPATTIEHTPVVGGDETILLVEDNEHLRLATTRHLTALGYRVHEAADAATALRVLHHADETIDLLFTDVVMPGSMDGIDLACEAIRLRAKLRVLVTSGFPTGRLRVDRVCECTFHLLSKPFGHDALARAVRQALDSNGEASVDNCA